MLGAIGLCGSNARIEMCTKSFEDGSGWVAARKGKKYQGKLPCQQEPKQGATSSVCPRNRANYPSFDLYVPLSLTNYLRS